MELAHPQLRFALREHLGRVLAPEVAARIEAMATVNVMPLPEVAGSTLTNEQRPEFFKFVNDGLAADFDPGKSRVFARVTDCVIRAVVLYTDVRRWSVEMVVVSDGSKEWMSRQLLRAAFSYPFVQLGKERVTARIESTNHQAVALDEGLGFVHEGVQRRQFGDNDCVLMGMLRRECRWIKGHQHD